MKLIIFNGPCGVGKSTIAVRLHETLPLSILLDADSLRRLFSGYREKREESRIVSLKLAETMMITCLDMGHDVIIDKMQFDTAVLDKYLEIAKQKGVAVKEIILWASKEVVMERAGVRGWKEGGLLTPEKCEAFWHGIDDMKDKRSNAVIIDTTHLSSDESFAKVAEVVNERDTV
ncbi:MAG: AAA family ATPase [Candidatus Moraniibacteriota bacterium]